MIDFLSNGLFRLHFRAFSNDQMSEHNLDYVDSHSNLLTQSR